MFSVKLFGAFPQGMAAGSNQKQSENILLATISSY